MVYNAVENLSMGAVARRYRGKCENEKKKRKYGSYCSEVKDRIVRGL